MMRIQQSIDWTTVETNLYKKSRGFSYTRDINKLISNIRVKVTELSKAEIDARRGRPYRAEELLAEINRDIELVEEYILMASLIG